MTKIIKTFIIRHKETKKIWTARSGKASWKQAGHAKSAWANSDHRNTSGIKLENVKSLYTTLILEYPKFNAQGVYECIELKHESEEKLQEACELLKEALFYVVTSNSAMVEQIGIFIKENSEDD